MVVGKKPIEEYLKNLSLKIPLSMKYTNHSVRPTTIGNLDAAGFEAHHIQAVLGHKSEETIKCYTRKCPPKIKHKMCESLSEKIGNTMPKAPMTDQTYNDKINVNKDENSFPTINTDQFQDFIPIENNSDDFDLSNILQEVEQPEQNIKISKPNPKPTFRFN